METSTAIDDPEMQRLLFSDNPPLLREMPVFGPPVDLPPFYSEPTQELISSDPRMRVAEAACMADDADCAFASVQDLLDTGTDPRGSANLFKQSYSVWPRGFGADASIDWCACVSGGCQGRYYEGVDLAAFNVFGVWVGH